MAEPTQKSKTKITGNHLQSFRPNLMHSIDGSIMRFFISEFFKKTKGQRLNHLHDCVMLHPNGVGIFYELVEELYCDPKMLSLANDLVFKRFKRDTVGPPRHKIEEIQQIFSEKMGSFELTKGTFNTRHCYRYEGAK